MNNPEAKSRGHMLEMAENSIATQSPWRGDSSWLPAIQVSETACAPANGIFNLHLDVFEQPQEKYFFNIPIINFEKYT
jgi:hypothetical protein